MKEEYRKTAHMLFGLLIALFIYFADETLSLCVMAAVVFISLCISEAAAKGMNVPLFSAIIRGLERPGVYPGKGTILFFISTLVCLILFDKSITCAAVVTLAVLDGISTIIGIRYGKHKIYKKKSLEGTLAGIIAGTAALCICMPDHIIPAAAAAVIAGIVELYTPVDDNLTVPLSVCIVLSLFAVYLPAF